MRQLLMISLITTLLISCGGSGSNEESNDDNGGGGNPTTVNLSVFEGSIVTLNTELTGDNIQWQQLSGPQILIDTSTQNQVNADIPWIENGPVTAEFEVTAQVNGQTTTQAVVLDINDRRYLSFRVADNTASRTDLYIRYIEVEDGIGVPETGTLKMTSVADDVQVCGYSISPTGRYIAYSKRAFDASFRASCEGMFIVDITDSIEQKISALAIGNGEISVGGFLWSPNEQSIAYRADVGFGVTQLYVTDVESATTSYVNYDFNSLATGVWPSEDLYPYPDNMSALDDLVDNPNLGFEIDWAGNDGLAFSVIDNDTFDSAPHIASIHGDARLLERYSWPAIDYFLEGFDYSGLCQQADDSPDCVATVVSGLTNDIFVDRRFINPRRMETSVDGYLAIWVDMVVTETNFQTMEIVAERQIPVLTIRPPIADNDVVEVRMPIEALEVTDMAWSPVARDMAFSSNSDVSHQHSSDIGIDDQLLLSETPGQLYLFNDFDLAHELPQERLSNPVPDVDENPVVALEWSSTGAQIAYARGETLEGNFFTSLWVTLVDDVRDQTSATIKTNTTLLADPDEFNSVSIKDFQWSPSGNGVAYVQSSLSAPPTSTSLWFARTDGSTPIEILTTAGNIDSAQLNGWTFSPDGQYIAYLNDEDTAIFVRPTNGDNAAQIGRTANASGRILRDIQWTANGGLIYRIDENGTSDFQRYLVTLDNQETDLSMFFSANETIIEFRQK